MRGTQYSEGSAVRESDVHRLKTRYLSPVVPEPEEGRLGPALGIDLRAITQLGDAFVSDLGSKKHGIEWWSSHTKLDHKTRILISDHLVACARAIPQNLLEARVYELELSHAIDDFRSWLERAVSAKKVTVPPPRGPYDDLASYRISANLVGIFRAFASALDCLGGLLGRGRSPPDWHRACRPTESEGCACESRANQSASRCTRIRACGI